MKFGDIDWNSSRGVAYKLAKDEPGSIHQFQTEFGLATVHYRRGSGDDEVIPGLIMKGQPGHWFEKPVLDKTKIIPDANTIGIRVYDED